MKNTLLLQCNNIQSSLVLLSLILLSVLLWWHRFNGSVPVRTEVAEVHVPGAGEVAEVHVPGAGEVC